MKNFHDFIIILMLIIELFCVVSAFFAGYQQGKYAGYENACKDFYNGKLKMERIEFEDGTVEWKEIKEK